MPQPQLTQAIEALHITGMHQYPPLVQAGESDPFHALLRDIDIWHHLAAVEADKSEF